MPKPSPETFFCWYAPPPDRVREDAYVAAPACGVFAVADGVTRDPNPDGTYPSPSPARAAADRFCQVVQERACHDPDLRAIFVEANAQIRSLNAELRLDTQPDYLTRDLAGTVAVVARQDNGRLDWCYVGDCGAALLDETGRILRITRDDVSAARPHFPTKKTLPHDDHRRAYIRSRLRNRPTSAGAYGVLTGQAEAPDFVREGSWPWRGSNVALIFSDGFRPYLEAQNVPEVLVEAVRDPGRRTSARQALDALRRSGQVAAADDEATVMAWSPHG